MSMHQIQRADINICSKSPAKTFHIVTCFHCEAEQGTESYQQSTELTSSLVWKIQLLLNIDIDFNVR